MLEGRSDTTRTAYQSLVLADSPALYLPTDGSIADASPSARTVTPSRAQSYVEAPSGQGLTNTSGGTVAATYCAISPAVTGATLTLEIWSRYTGAPSYGTAFGCASNDHPMLLHRAGDLAWGAWTQPGGYKGPSTPRPTDTNWHHFVHVLTSASVGGTNDGTIQQYLDGVAVGSSFAHSLDTKTNGVTKVSDWGGTYPIGDWADAAVYTSALSPARIAAHYAQGVLRPGMSGSSGSTSLEESASGISSRIE